MGFILHTRTRNHETRSGFFDLDGTLADTAPDLGGALNTLLASRFLPAVLPERYRPMAGHGSVALLALAGITPQSADFARWQQDYLNEYARREHQSSTLFDGVADLLDGLARRGLTWGIITNKPQRFTERLLAKLALPVPPDVVVCGDTCAEPKPSALPMLYACEQTGVPPEHCLYVGDAERDMQAGRAAGMTTVLARWGYIPAHERPQQWDWDYEVYEPADILTLPCFFD